jgi:hypothetical protein
MSRMLAGAAAADWDMAACVHTRDWQLVVRLRSAANEMAQYLRARCRVIAVNHLGTSLSR